MKTKILLLATAMMMAINFGAYAQAPEKFNYQGIARDNTGAALANQSLGIKINILHNTTVDYSETHTVTTNDFGLYTLVIGDGTPTFGGMASVDWNSGNKYIKVEIDPNGGTNYTDLGTTELLSVPYALYAIESGGSGSGAPTGPAGGDLSGSYPNPNIANNAINSAKIANNAVQTANLANAAVTAAKLDDMGAVSGEVLKWDGTSWAPATDIQGTTGTTYTAGTGISISGSNEISADLGTDISTAELQNNAVTSGKIANGAVTAAKIDDMGATSGQVLEYDGTNWAPATFSTGALWTQNGSDISYSGGNVGVGTNSPDSPLHIQAGAGGFSSINNALKITSGTTAIEDWYFYLNANDDLTIRDDGNDVFRIENSTGDINITESLDIAENLDIGGTVGIGTTSPIGKMEITGSMGMEDFVTISPSSVAGGSYDVLQLIAPPSATNFDYVQIGTSGSASVFKIREDGSVESEGDITAAGKVGIGTPSPDTELHIRYADMSTSGSGGNHGLTIENNDNANFPTSINFQVGQNSNNLYIYDADDNYIAGIDGTSGAYSAISDANLKTGFQPMGSVLPQLMKLNALSYRFIDQQNDERHLGFIAQEVEKLFPSIVNNPNNEDGSEGNYTMNYSAFGVIAVRAIQEQQQTIETLQDTIQKMQARLDALEQKQ